MPSGTKYIRHQKAVEFLKETQKVDWAGSYKEYANLYGKDANFKNSDLLTILENQVASYEVKCHKAGSDWGEISWDQAERLLMSERIIIVEDNDIKEFEGRVFVEKFCYFTKNGRIHYNYLRRNKRVTTHSVSINKIQQARRLFA